MAPIKFEEHVKEKLDDRNIQPSAGSWDKLNSELDKSQGKRKSISMWISSIAAIAIMLIAGIFYINQQKIDQGPSYVEEPAKTEEIIKKPGFDSSNDETSIAEEDAQISEKTELNESTIKTSNKSEIRSNEKNLEEGIAVNEEKIAVNNRAKDRLEPVVVENLKPQLKQTKPLSTRLESVIANAKISNKIVEDATEAEVDALLMQAARDITEKQFEISYERVDAEALLAGTERELDESFRNQVFEKLKENFLKAKTAVATRND